MESLADSDSIAAARLGFERIICAIDGKDGGFEAVRQAASLLAPGGQLTLLLVTSARSEAVHGPAIGPGEAHEAVKEAEAIASAAGVRCTVEVDPAAPSAPVVLSWASDYDLLAIGAPSSSWLGGLVIAGVGDSAVRDLRTPVLTARPCAEGLWRHVMIASDALDDSAPSTSVGGLLAGSRDARVTLLHAFSHHPQAERERVLAQAGALGEQGLRDPDVVFRHGRAHEAIVELAELLDVSLVVQGSRRHGGLRALGSVSRRVVHEAGCSVLTVPPDANVALA